jgi:hypothetical protein
MTSDFGTAITFFVKLVSRSIGVSPLMWTFIGPSFVFRDEVAAMIDRYASAGFCPTNCA